MFVRIIWSCEMRFSVGSSTAAREIGFDCFVPFCQSQEPELFLISGTTNYARTKSNWLAGALADWFGKKTRERIRFIRFIPSFIFMWAKPSREPRDLVVRKDGGGYVKFRGELNFLGSLLREIAKKKLVGLDKSLASWTNEQNKETKTWGTLAHQKAMRDGCSFAGYSACRIIEWQSK